MFLSVNVKTHFLEAVEDGDKAKVKRILSSTKSRKQVIVNGVNEYGQSALMIALDARCIEIVKLLIRHDADTTAEDKFNQRVYHYATRSKQNVLIDYLKTMQKKNKDDDLPIYPDGPVFQIDVLKKLRKIYGREPGIEIRLHTPLQEDYRTKSFLADNNIREEDLIAIILPGEFVDDEKSSILESDTTIEKKDPCLRDFLEEEISELRERFHIPEETLDDLVTQIAKKLGKLFDKTIPEKLHHSVIDTHQFRSLNSLRRSMIKKKSRDYLIKLLAHMLTHRKPLIVMDRRWRMRSHSKCFVSSEFVDWIVKYQKLKRQQAATLGTEMVEQNLIRHVQGKTWFKDGFFFYKFTSEVIHALPLHVQDFDIAKLLTDEQEKLQHIPEEKAEPKKTRVSQLRRLKNKSKFLSRSGSYKPVHKKDKDDQNAASKKSKRLKKIKSEKYGTLKTHPSNPDAGRQRQKHKRMISENPQTLAGKITHEERKTLSRSLPSRKFNRRKKSKDRKKIPDM